MTYLVVYWHPTIARGERGFKETFTDERAALDFAEDIVRDGLRAMIWEYKSETLQCAA